MEYTPSTPEVFHFAPVLKKELRRKSSFFIFIVWFVSHTHHSYAKVPIERYGSGSTHARPERAEQVRPGEVRSVCRAAAKTPLGDCGLAGGRGPGGGLMWLGVARGGLERRGAAWGWLGVGLGEAVYGLWRERVALRCAVMRWSARCVGQVEEAGGGRGGAVQSRRMSGIQPCFRLLRESILCPSTAGVVKRGPGSR